MSNIFNSLIFVGCLAACFGLAGCLHSDYSKAKHFVPQDMAGEINGEEWQYKHAYIDPTVDVPGEEDFVFVFLPYKPKKPCPVDENQQADLRTVMASAPKLKKPVKLKRGTGRTLMFHYERDGEMVTAPAKLGKVQLTQIGPRTVKGRIMGTYNGDNWVNGDFTAVVCDYAEMR